MAAAQMAWKLAVGIVVELAAAHIVVVAQPVARTEAEVAAQVDDMLAHSGM